MVTNSSLVAFHNSDLARALADACSFPIYYAKKTVFADGEFQVTLEDSADFSFQTVYIVHTTSNPMSDSLLSVAFLAHELKNAGAARIVAIIPYLGYTRQSESTIPGKPGNMAVIAKMLEGAGINEVLTVEMHTDSVRELFTIPVHSISVHDVLARSIKQIVGTRTDICLVAPDEGARQRVVALAQELGFSYIVFCKERYAADQTRLVSYEGHVSGSCAIIIDDIIATGGTAVQVCTLLHKMNFSMVYGYFVHPVFAGSALEKIGMSHFDAVMVGNTITLSPAVSECLLVASMDVSSAVVQAVRTLWELPLKQTNQLSSESSL